MFAFCMPLLLDRDNNASWRGETQTLSSALCKAIFARFGFSQTKKRPIYLVTARNCVAVFGEKMSHWNLLCFIKNRFVPEVMAVSGGIGDCLSSFICCEGVEIYLWAKYQRNRIARKPQ